MKKVEVIIPHDSVDAVKKAIGDSGGHNMCVVEASGVATSSETNFGTSVPLLKIEIFLEDHEAERVADAVSRALGGGDEVNVFLTKAETAMRFHRVTGG